MDLPRPNLYHPLLSLGPVPNLPPAFVGAWGGDSFFESMRKSEGAGGLLRGPWRHRGHSCLAFEETDELETATDPHESEAGSVKQPFEATRDLPREFRRDLWSAMVGPILDHHYFYPVFSIY